jgi:16S rRNA (guanine966-N2)-methyltransferase
MRIIAGDHRGRSILGPIDDQTTRPIIDRVKEALFNRLASLGMMQPDGDKESWNAVDVFSGTGSLGLEALSRGAANCTFVDQDRTAISRLNENIETLGLADRAQVVQGSALAGYWSASIPPGSVQVAFIDPPYVLMTEKTDRPKVLSMVQHMHPIMEQGGVAIVRTPVEVTCEEIEGYDGPITTDYGNMRLHFYQVPMGE